MSMTEATRSIAPSSSQGNHQSLAQLSKVSQRGGVVDLATQLAELRHWLSDDLIHLEVDLEAVAALEGDVAERALAHLVGQPGKRLRPICIFLTSKLGDGTTLERIRDLGVAVELAHAATLLHDDVIDQGTERRGAPTSRVLFGNPASVLGGDYLLIEALRRVRRSGTLDLLDGFLTAIDQMIRAEVNQLEWRGQFSVDPDRYDQIAMDKTAILFRWAMEAGATVGGASSAEIDAVSRVGTALGMAFQIIDDALDIAGDPARTGKDALIDLKEGKLTWPLIEACQQKPQLKAKIATMVDQGRWESQALSALHQEILATNCVERTRARARHFANIAYDALETLPTGGTRRALHAVITAAVERDF